MYILDKSDIQLIRNKRILQLEQQVGYAADSIAARDTVTDSTNDSMHTVLKKIEIIENKLNSLSAASPSNSIVINTCKAANSDNTHQRNTDSAPSQTINTYHDCTADLGDIGTNSTVESPETTNL